MNILNRDANVSNTTMKPQWKRGQWGWMILTLAMVVSAIVVINDSCLSDHGDLSSHIRMEVLNPTSQEISTLHGEAQEFRILLRSLSDSSPAKGETVVFRFELPGGPSQEPVVIRTDSDGIASAVLETYRNWEAETIVYEVTAQVQSDSRVSAAWVVVSRLDPNYAAYMGRILERVREIIQSEVIYDRDGLSESELSDLRENHYYEMIRLLDNPRSITDLNLMLSIYADTILPSEYRSAPATILVAANLIPLRRIDPDRFNALVSDTVTRLITPLFYGPASDPQAAEILYFFGADTSVREFLKQAYVADSPPLISRFEKPGDFTTFGPDPAYEDIYRAGLASPRREIRFHSAWMLIQMGNLDEIVPVLRADMISVTERTREGRVIGASREAQIGGYFAPLERIGTKEAAEAIAIVFGLGETPHMRSLQQSAIYTIERMGHLDVVPVEWDYLGDGDPRRQPRLPDDPAIFGPKYDTGMTSR